MIEIYFIYIIYIILYFFESLFWIPKNSIIVYFSNKKDAKLYSTSQVFCNQHNSLALSSILFPYRLFSVLPFPQISISDEHIFVYAITSLKERQLQENFISYKFLEIEKIESQENELFINNKVFVKFYSSSQAKFWQTTISNLVKAKQQNRDGNLYLLLDTMFDTQAIADKIKIYRQETKLLRILNSILLLVLITNATAMFFVTWFVDYFWYSVIALYTLSFVSGLRFYFVQKRLISSTIFKQITSTLKMMFYPPSAIGSVSEFSTNMFSEFHPLAVISEFCDDETFHKFAGQFLRDLLYPLAHTYPQDNHKFTQIEESWRNRLIEKTKQFLIQKNIDIEILLQPNITDNQSSYYCPRCLTLYSKELEFCSDCYGVKPLQISS